MGNTGSSLGAQFKPTGSYAPSPNYSQMMQNLYGNQAQRAAQIPSFNNFSMPSYGQAYAQPSQNQFARLASYLMRGRQLYNLGSTVAAAAPMSGTGATAYGAGMAASGAMPTSAVNIPMAGASMSPGMGFMSALPGIGTAMAGTAALGTLGMMGIKALRKGIGFGNDTTIQEKPTQELLEGYNKSSHLPGALPVYLELQQRGVSGLTPMSSKTANQYYYDVGAPSEDEFGKIRQRFDFA